MGFYAVINSDQRSLCKWGSKQQINEIQIRMNCHKRAGQSTRDRARWTVLFWWEQTTRPSFCSYILLKSSLTFVLCESVLGHDLLFHPTRSQEPEAVLLPLQGVTLSLSGNHRPPPPPRLKLAEPSLPVDIRLVHRRLQAMIKLKKWSVLGRKQAHTHTKKKKRKKKSPNVLVLKTSTQVKLYEIEFSCHWKYSIHILIKNWALFCGILL